MILAEIERWLSASSVARTGESRVLVACSGGRDSVVLAHACCELLGSRRVVLGHIDHQVREGSAEDGRFVGALAERLGAGAAIDTASPASDSEAELRRVRYEGLESQRARWGAELIMTAHTRDDQAETVLLQLLRTTELEAMRGIERHRDRILRPLLDVPRALVAEHARAHRLSWREDPTNAEPRYLRNRIRKELLPLIELRYRARFTERLAALAEVARSPRIRSEGPRVETKGSELVQTASLISTAISMRCVAWSGGPVPEGREVAVFDAELLVRPAVRNFRPGDKIQPFGMKGRTKVAEVLRAAGVPQELRAQALLVVDEADQVMWVPGVVRAAGATVELNTKRVWIFEVRDNAVLQPAERRATLEAAGEGPGLTLPTDERNDQ